MKNCDVYFFEIIFTLEEVLNKPSHYVYSFGDYPLAINTAMHHRLVVYVQCPYNARMPLKTQSSLA